LTDKCKEKDKIKTCYLSNDVIDNLIDHFLDYPVIKHQISAWAHLCRLV